MLRNLSKVGQLTSGSARIQTRVTWLRVGAPDHAPRYSNIETETNSENGMFYTGNQGDEREGNLAGDGGGRHLDWVVRNGLSEEMRLV